MALVITNAIPISGSKLPLSIKKCHHYQLTTLAFAAIESTTTPTCHPAVILPGLGNNSGDYQKLQLTLKDYGVPTVVAKVSRSDWLRNAAGLADPNYWQGTLRPRPVLDWYLKRVDEAVIEAKLLAEDGCLSVIGHSAGGWLARVYMEEFGISDISLLLTLGTPHRPPPKGLPGVIDQTRGLLNYVERYCSKAIYTPQLKYVCIAGRYIKGARFFGNSKPTSQSSIAVESDQTMTEVAVLDKVLVENGESITDVNVIDNTQKTTSTANTARARFIGQGYKQVCGQADVWGDGVVPEVSAHLDGALNITLDGVYHSPVGSDDVLRPWYGSPAVVEKWIHHLLS
ncbi:alpha/beta-Hydrolases superfamily protein [Thalictrum thalictroides]|uniref:GPI inositol-deacylase n=1 Tax=Thalictrum thalictroides TaxID=46969 RepID=A0A7J6W5T4_THATH|nr:alpha/beta-Hydrolases superfamily protein [Thalictrum thalictroides]